MKCFSRSMPALTVVLALVAVLALMPGTAEAQTPFENSIVDVLEAQGDFTIFLSTLESAGFQQALESDGPYTVFAPTDAAFEALPEGQLEALLQDPEALAGLLGLHLAPGEIDAATLATQDLIETAFGEPVTVTIDGEDVRLNNATVVDTEYLADNGLVHVVDEVIMAR